MSASTPPEAPELTAAVVPVGDHEPVVDAPDDGAPWLRVVAAPRAAHPLDSVAAALDVTTTRFVGFRPAVLRTSEQKKRLTHARKLATACGLADVSFPLPVLTAWSDHEVLETYRRWVAEHHADEAAGVREGLDAYLRLLPWRNLAATLDGVDFDAERAVLMLTGSCRRGAADTPVPPDQRVTVVVKDRAGQVLLRVPTGYQLRSENGVRRWTGFTAEIAAADLPLGSSLLSVEAEAPEGHKNPTKPVKVSIGAAAASRPLVIGDRRLQVLSFGAGDQAEILCLADGSALSRARWAGAMAARDARSMARRRPFAWVRLARFLTRPAFLGRPIWLVGERADTARDNGYHLFVHLRKHRRDIRAYYVIDKDSDQYARVAGLGRVVHHSSWRHRLLMLHAQVLTNAYSIKHMAPSQWDPTQFMRAFSWRTGAFRAYLNHGVNVNTEALRRRIGGYDIYLTTSVAEAAACREMSGYGHHIKQIGLPRYDALVPTPPSRTILFMPTWRQYLAAKLFSDSEGGDIEFEGSDYQRFILAFLSSERLRDLLERHDYKLRFMPHYNLRHQLADVPVGSDRIEVADGASADIQNFMLECDLFVTDHSSVHFDIAYLGTPVVYSHFDEADYRAGHAGHSWFDHARDGFGPVVNDLDTTLDAIEHYLESGCVREPLYDERAEAAFTYHDRDNTRRAVEAVEHLVRTRGAV